MNKRIPLIAAALTLAGCSNFAPDLGVPTVRFTVTGFGPEGALYFIDLAATPQPGSPDGQILEVWLADTPSLPPEPERRPVSLVVPSCPPEGGCSPIPFRLLFPQDPGERYLVAYQSPTAFGGLRRVLLEPPVPIHRSVLTNPSFDLVVPPLNLEIQQESELQTILSLVPRGGFSGTVGLALVGLPSGIQLSPALLEVPGGSPLTAPITIRVGPEVFPGAYTFTLRAQAGSVVREAPGSLTVRPKP